MDVTNPGLVNAADQGDGLTVVDQPVMTGPSQNAGVTVQIADQSDGLTVVDQPVTTGPSQNAGVSVQGGTYSPQSPRTANTTENTVVNQTYGTGDPTNVFV